MGSAWQHVVIWTVTAFFTIWYFHEYHNTTFMDISRNVPYVSSVMMQIHSMSKYLYTSSSKTPTGKERLMTSEQLSKYSGIPGSKGLYLSILGKIYDVKKGKKHYGPGGSYHVFAGRDSSKAFVSGEFTDDKATDDVIALSGREILSLLEWQDFYSKEYVYIGKLIGRFYDEKGQETEYFKEFMKKVELAKFDKENNNMENLLFPPCNVEWTPDEGSTVWCTNMSGGVKRSWIGVPRKLYAVGSEAARCACIDLEQVLDPNSPQYARRGLLEEYEKCHPKATSCRVHT